jgi:hypothetical protein
LIGLVVQICDADFARLGLSRQRPINRPRNGQSLFFAVADRFPIPKTASRVPLSCPIRSFPPILADAKGIANPNWTSGQLFSGCDVLALSTIVGDLANKKTMRRYNPTKQSLAMLKMLNIYGRVRR